MNASSDDRDRVRSWSDDTCKTWDDKDHNYRATECHSMAGVAIVIAFEEYGSFTASSEEDAIFVFQEWYKKNVKSPEDDMPVEVRKPPVRDIDPGLR